MNRLGVSSLLALVVSSGAVAWGQDSRPAEAEDAGLIHFTVAGDRVELPFVETDREGRALFVLLVNRGATGEEAPSGLQPGERMLVLLIRLDWEIPAQVKVFKPREAGEPMRVVEGYLGAEEPPEHALAFFISNDGEEPIDFQQESDRWVFSTGGTIHVKELSQDPGGGPRITLDVALTFPDDVSAGGELRIPADR